MRARLPARKSAQSVPRPPARWRRSGCARTSWPKNSWAKAWRARCSRTALPKRVLLARAQLARDALPELLRQAGAQVEVVPVYETVAADAGLALRAHFEQGQIDVALFTSSSTVNAVVDMLGAQAAQLLSRVTVASIGPITSQTLRERGVRADVVATLFTVDGLLDALETHFSSAH